MIEYFKINLINVSKAPNVIILFDLVITLFRFNPEENQQYRRMIAAALFMLLKLHSKLPTKKLF